MAKQKPLDDIRHDVRMDGVSFFRTRIDGPFVKSLDPGNFSYCVMVRSGRIRVETDFPVRTEIEVGAGDTVAVSGLAPHTLSSSLAPKAKTPGRFEREQLDRNATKADVELVIGTAPNESLALGSLMVGPIVVRAREQPGLSRRLWRAVEMLEDEYADESWIDRNLVIRRLAEIMLVNMSRALLAHRESLPGEARGEIADAQVMKAITAFFSAPGKAWTLPDLARAAGMSRTRFAETFKLVTGQTPKRIISRMRLTAIARRLSSAALSVERAAEEAGYGSSAAFVRAFQREFGETPARWRRQQTARPPVAPSRGRAGRAQGRSRK
jgi:AraC-like DNA-binding protein